MGLDELRKGVLDRAREEARAVAKEAEAEASAMLEKAREQRRELMEAARREARELVEAERSEAVANARLEAKRELAKAREELVASVERQVWKELLKARRGRRKYAKLLHSLIEGGRKALGGGGALVYVNAQDRKLVGELRDAKLAREHLQCSGGAVVTSEDGRVRIDNTLEALFAEKADRMRIEIQKAVL